MLSNVSWITRFTSLLFLVSIFLLNWESDRTEFITLILGYALAFTSYLVLLKRSDLEFKHLAAIAIVAQLLSMIFEPYLSVDYYRFIWDGELAWNQINPFDYRPVGIITQPFMRGNEYMNEIYSNLSELSAYNYSCYPTINQAYFIFATAFSSSIAVNTFFLKLAIVLTEIVGAIYLFKILKHLGLPSKRMWILFLNPLFIIECTGNTHFEGVMISFLFVALYFTLQKKVLQGGFWMAIAVQIKIVPLLFLPFFLRYLGWWKTFLFCAITIGVAGSIGLIHFNADNIGHFTESLILYFRVFEFNSFFFYNILQIGKPYYGWNPIRIFGPVISQVSMFIVLVQAFWGNANTWQKLFSRITVAFFIYLLIASTVHPWYVLPLLAMSIFTNYSFPIVWSLLIFSSYFFYSIGSGDAFEVRALITIEYLIVIGVFLYEIIKKKPLIRFLKLN